MEPTNDTAATDRNGLEVLHAEECWDLLAATPIGRVAFKHDGDVVILPVNFAVSGRHIVFRSSRGAKFGAATMGRTASFEADHFDTESRTGWSVLIEGNAEMVIGREEAALDEMELDLWAPLADDPVWMRIRPLDISGRRITATGA